MNTENSASVEHTFPDVSFAQQLFGVHNGNLKILEDRLGLKIHSYGNGVRLDGIQQVIEMAGSVLDDLYKLIESGHEITQQDVLGAADHYRHGETGRIADQFEKSAAIQVGAERIVPKNAAQTRYIAAIRANTVTLGVGPAGTGKTYLAVAAGLEMLAKKQVRRIVISRPVVEAGEKLGFLPGDLLQKIDPYLRPIYDAVEDINGVDRMREMMDRGVIEIAPLAYMRGRTLNQTFILLDEAQNTTRGQMMMILTRLGNQSKMVINGDDTQIDLPHSSRSGLIEAVAILNNIEGIGTHHFSSKDVIRHRIVGDIIDAYANAARTDHESKE